MNFIISVKGLALTTGCSWVLISWLDKYFFLSSNFLWKKCQNINHITKNQPKMYKIITLYYKRTGRAVGKSSRMIQSIVSEATTGSFFAIKSWFPVRPSQSVNFSPKKSKIGTLIDKKSTKFITFYYFYCKKLARNL